MNYENIFSFIGLNGNLKGLLLNKPRPNVLLIIADDMGKDANLCYFVSQYRPKAHNLKKLCQTGVVFDNFWVAPVCSPTRASILTGKYGFRTGVLGVAGRRGQ